MAKQEARQRITMPRKFQVVIHVSRAAREQLSAIALETGKSIPILFDEVLELAQGQGWPGSMEDAEEFVKLGSLD